MISKILEQLQRFSQENWWVYILFILSLGFVYFTKTGDPTELLLVFIVYFSAELCMMVMVQLMHEKKYAYASIYQFVGNIIFTILFTYHFLVNDQAQYFLSSGIFILGAVKNLLLYNTKYNLKIVNPFSIALLGFITYISYYSLHISELKLSVFIQAIGIIVFSSYLVAEKKQQRDIYLLGLGGLTFMVLGSIMGVYQEYLTGSIYGVSIAYVIMPFSVLLVYIKNIKKYF